MSDAARDSDRPLLQVVRGKPTTEELAALVAVVSARVRTGEGGDPRARSAWTERARLVRQVPAAGPGAWLRSGWPR